MILMKITNKIERMKMLILLMIVIVNVECQDTRNGQPSPSADSQSMFDEHHKGGTQQGDAVSDKNNFRNRFQSESVREEVKNNGKDLKEVVDLEQTTHSNLKGSDNSDNNDGANHDDEKDDYVKRIKEVIHKGGGLNKFHETLNDRLSELDDEMNNDYYDDDDYDDDSNNHQENELEEIFSVNGDDGDKKLDKTGSDSHSFQNAIISARGNNKKSRLPNDGDTSSSSFSSSSNSKKKKNVGNTHDPKYDVVDEGNGGVGAKDGRLVCGVFPSQNAKLRRKSRSKKQNSDGVSQNGEYRRWMVTDDGKGVNLRMGRVDDGRDGNHTVTLSTEVCQPNKRCYVLWIVDPNNRSKVEVESQGCQSKFEDKCEQEACVGDHSSKLLTFFCCCNTHMCNTRFKNNASYYDGVSMQESNLETTTSSAIIIHDTNSYREKTIVIALVSVMSVAFLVIMIYLPYRLCLRRKVLYVTPPSSSERGGEGDGDGSKVGTSSDHHGDYHPLEPIDFESLKMDEMLYKGQFSEVWKGSSDGGKEVAIKVYTPNYKQYYRNECICYNLPYMQHHNVAKFLGSKVKGGDQGSNPIQYMIVLQYYPLGSLTEYLKKNMLDWKQLFSMGLDICKGLAHLHTDIQIGESFKPALAHRDFNTRNILVTSDLCCVLTDLGFCTAMMGSKVFKNGTTEMSEQTSLTEVGTIRYLAPEVFDGAVNLCDCEASLKQVDVYSLGLVLWEIASRCEQLYQGAPVPDYQLPFQAEAGTHPTFLAMQSLVVHYKTRPKFPNVWRESNPAVRCLKETIEECWDSDPEARLTAPCVQERFADMPSLWLQGSRQRGVTPTLNATQNIGDTLHFGQHQGSTPIGFVSKGVAYLPEYIDTPISIDDNVNESDDDLDEKYSDDGSDSALGRVTESSSSDPPTTNYQDIEKGLQSPQCEINRSSFNWTMKDDVQGNDIVDDGIHEGSSVTSPLIDRRNRQEYNHYNGSNGMDSNFEDRSSLTSHRSSMIRDASLSGSTVDTWVAVTPSVEQGSLEFSHQVDNSDISSNVATLPVRSCTSHCNGEVVALRGSNSQINRDAPIRNGNAVQSNSSVPAIKASNVTLALNKTVLHAHQGRNPTVERNTHKSSDEELTISGNRLIASGDESNVDDDNVRTSRSKPVNADMRSNRNEMTSSRMSSVVYSLTDQQTCQALPQPTMNTIYNGIYSTTPMTSVGEASSLIQNDSLNQNTVYHHQPHYRNAAPILYVQNQVHPVITSPDQNHNSNIAGSIVNPLTRPKLDNREINPINSNSQVSHQEQNVSSHNSQNTKSHQFSRQTQDGGSQNKPAGSKTKSKSKPSLNPFQNLGTKISQVVAKLRNKNVENSSSSCVSTLSTSSFNQNADVNRKRYSNLSEHTSTPSSPFIDNNCTHYVNEGLETPITRRSDSYDFDQGSSTSVVSEFSPITSQLMAPQTKSNAKPTTVLLVDGSAVTILPTIHHHDVDVDLSPFTSTMTQSNATIHPNDTLSVMVPIAKRNLPLTLIPSSSVQIDNSIISSNSMNQTSVSAPCNHINISTPPSYQFSNATIDAASASNHDYSTAIVNGGSDSAASNSFHPQSHNSSSIFHPQLKNLTVNDNQDLNDQFMVDQLKLIDNHDSLHKNIPVNKNDSNNWIPEKDKVLSKPQLPQITNSSEYSSHSNIYNIPDSSPSLSSLTPNMDTYHGVKTSLHSPPVPGSVNTPFNYTTISPSLSSVINPDANYDKSQTNNSFPVIKQEVMADSQCQESLSVSSSQEVKSTTQNISSISDDNMSRKKESEMTSRGNASQQFVNDSRFNSCPNNGKNGCTVVDYNDNNINQSFDKINNDDNEFENVTREVTKVRNDTDKDKESQPQKIIGRPKSLPLQGCQYWTDKQMAEKHEEQNSIKCKSNCKMMEDYKLKDRVNENYIVDKVERLLNKDVRRVSLNFNEGHFDDDKDKHDDRNSHINVDTCDREGLNDRNSHINVDRCDGEGLNDRNSHINVDRCDGEGLNAPTINLNSVPMTVFKTSDSMNDGKNYVDNNVNDFGDKCKLDCFVDVDNNNDFDVLSNNGNKMSEGKKKKIKTKKSDKRSSSLKENRSLKTSESGEKIRRRIKTPVSFKNGRLSLYDDRLMSYSDGIELLKMEANKTVMDTVDDCGGNAFMTHSLCLNGDDHQDEMF